MTADTNPRVKPVENKLMIVTDLGRLKAYRVEFRLFCSPQMHLVEDYYLADAHKRITDQLSDMLGRRRAPFASQAQTGGDRHNLELELNRRLLKTVARKIHDLMKDGNYSGCYLAAGKEINSRLWDALPASVRSKVEVNIARDLTKMDKGQLLDYFGLKRTSPGKRRPTVGS